MPRYDYYCKENHRTIEVSHSIHVKLTSWRELCNAADIELGDTPADTAVEKIITTAPMMNTPTGNSDLKSQGFTKLVKRQDGTYENVTRTGTEKRFLDPKDPSSMPHLHKKISD
jgi:hypothetical protein